MPLLLLKVWSLAQQQWHHLVACGSPHPDLLQEGVRLQAGHASLPAHHSS